MVRKQLKTAVYVGLAAGAAARREIERTAKRLMRKYKIDRTQGKKIAGQLAQVMDRQTESLRKQAAKVVAQQADKAFSSARDTLKELNKTLDRLQRKAKGK